MLSQELVLRLAKYRVGGDARLPADAVRYLRSAAKYLMPDAAITAFRVAGAGLQALATMIKRLDSSVLSLPADALVRIEVCTPQGHVALRVSATLEKEEREGLTGPQVTVETPEAQP